MAREVEVRLRDFTNKKYFRQPRGFKILAHCLMGRKMMSTLTNIAMRLRNRKERTSVWRSKLVRFRRAQNGIEPVMNGDDSPIAAQLNEREAR
jgi:hypothetical protein